jgi:osmotically-inducible protein OsmY
LSGEQEASKANRVVSLAKDRLLQEPHLTIQRIWCEFDGEQLFLRGQVPSFYHKQLAQVAVADMEEVDRVINEIEVLW